MILIDTSIWVDHLSQNDVKMAGMLTAGTVVMHPLIIGELAMGQLRTRSSVLNQLKLMPMLPHSDELEVWSFVESQKLYGLGIGYIDAHLLTSVQLRPGTQFWTRDKRLATIAGKLKLACTD